MTDKVNTDTPAENSFTTSLTTASDLSAQLVDTRSWTDEKKNDFVKMFEGRVRVARYICAGVSNYILAKAEDRKFIGQRDRCQQRGPDLNALMDPPQGFAHYGTTVDGRSRDELQRIIEAQGEEILKQLPPLKKAVQVISPEIAAAIDERDEKLKKAKSLVDQIHELSQTIELADLDQKMTIGAFRQMVKDRAKARRKLVDELDEISQEGSKLTDKINTFLYKGLPGLSEAVIKTADEYYQRVDALGTLGRRVGEKVKFGDTPAALELLKHFEKDEVEVSSHIKAEFASAMEKLQLAGKKKAKKSKELSGGKAS